MKKIVIIGAGPAGLTAAYELLHRSGDVQVLVLEASDTVGGISKTVQHNGNRMDMGGHRFISKIPQVNAWWEKMLPTQGKLPIDDEILGRVSKCVQGGPDPKKEDNVMLRRNRLSRIYFSQKFFDYPISIKWSTIKNMGVLTTIGVGGSYLKALIFRRKEESLEDFFVNRFGYKLYRMFFENYTENLWGRHPRDISADWGAQRVRGLSVTIILKDIFGKLFHVKNRKIETSLIEEFAYPKYGPGQLWELTARKVKDKGGELLLQAQVIKLDQDENNQIRSVTYIKDGKQETVDADIVISSMPLKDLVEGLSAVPSSIAEIGRGLPYRDYITVGVLVDALQIKNRTKIKTFADIVPDQWIYVHEKNVKMGRIQIFNNWSPYLVKDYEHKVWMGLEYFCNEEDALWQMDDTDFARFATGELLSLGLIADKDAVKDVHVERVKKAYPAYFDTYARIDELRAYLDRIPNLYCIGRNGQHRYNNMDHSMCTAFEAVQNILTGKREKDNIWNVNTEKEYNEET